MEIVLNVQSEQSKRVKIRCRCGNRQEAVETVKTVTL